MEAAVLRRGGLLALDRTLLPPMPRLPARQAGEETRRREQVTRAVAAVLDGFGVFEGMNYDRQHQLISALLAVYFPDAQDT